MGRRLQNAKYNLTEYRGPITAATLAVAIATGGAASLDKHSIYPERPPVAVGAVSPPSHEKPRHTENTNNIYGPDHRRALPPEVEEALEVQGAQESAASAIQNAGYSIEDAQHPPIDEGASHSRKELPAEVVEALKHDVPGDFQVPSEG